MQTLDKIIPSLVLFLLLVTSFARADAIVETILETIVDANTASRQALQAMPHMSEELATSILENRPFATIGDLNDALKSTLDDKQLEELYRHVFVPLKLNSAANAHIRLIPGVGRKMAHEFEEYRPYKSMEQFRREIGKYVDETEVARLEQYVVLE